MKDKLNAEMENLQKNIDQIQQQILNVPIISQYKEGEIADEKDQIAELWNENAEKA